MRFDKGLNRLGELGGVAGLGRQRLVRAHVAGPLDAREEAIVHLGAAGDHVVFEALAHERRRGELAVKEVGASKGQRLGIGRVEEHDAAVRRRRVGPLESARGEERREKAALRDESGETRVRRVRDE